MNLDLISTALLRGSIITNYNNNSDREDQEKLVEFGIVQTDINNNFLSEPIVPILVNDRPYTETFKTQSLNEGRILLIGTAHKGDIITLDLSNATINHKNIWYSDSKNSFITELTEDSLSEIPYPYEYMIASSKFAVLAAWQCQIPNLFIKIAEDAQYPFGTWNVIINNTTYTTNKLQVSVGTQVKINQLNNKSPYYQIDDGDPIEIPNIADVGYRFTMPEGKVTLTVYPVVYA